MNLDDRPFTALPAPGPLCRISIGIPVRDEEHSISACLEALANQCDDDGNALDPRLYEILLFANNCSDQTIARAASFQQQRPEIALHLIDGNRCTVAIRNVAQARRAVLDACAVRMLHGGRDGYIATTDGDTLVAPTWVARTIEEFACVDVVCGRVLPTYGERHFAEIATSPVLALEHRYRYSLVRMESLLDPVIHDPWPRHGNHQGASFALRAAAYQNVGGVPLNELREDFALYRALLRHDFQVRHSLRVRVATSTRRISRVDGGFASDLSALDDHVHGRRMLLVDHPRYAMRLLRGRHALRAGDPAEAARIWGIDAALLRSVVSAAPEFGNACEQGEELARSSGHARPGIRIPLEDAIAYMTGYVQRHSQYQYGTENLEIA